MTEKKHGIENEDKSPCGRVLIMLGVMVVGLMVLMEPIIKDFLEPSNPPWIIPWVMAAFMATFVVSLFGAFTLSDWVGGV